MKHKIYFMLQSCYLMRQRMFAEEISMKEKFDEFFEEVKNDIRNERLHALWDKFKVPVIGVITLSFLGVGGYSFYNHYQVTQMQKQSELFISIGYLLMQDKTADALAVLHTFNPKSKHGYEILAQFLKASLQWKNKDTQEQSIASYKSIAANISLEQSWRDLATLMSVMRGIELHKEGLLNELGILLQENNPWYLFALEAKGIILLQQNKPKEALQEFSTIIRDAKAPSGLVSRAKLMLQTIQGII